VDDLLAAVAGRAVRSALHVLPREPALDVLQLELQLGYYQGPINGYLDSATRAAIANYQRDRELYTTSAIDELALASLGMA